MLIGSHAIIGCMISNDEMKEIRDYIDTGCMSMAETGIMIRCMPSVRFLRLKPLLITVMRTLDSFMSM